MIAIIAEAYKALDDVWVPFNGQFVNVSTAYFGFSFPVEFPTGFFSYAF
jgi:hypothetical protein